MLLLVGTACTGYALKTIITHSGIVFINSLLDNRMHMKIIDNAILSSLGLTSGEQKVYMAGLASGTCSSAQLIAFCKLPRPSVLAALKSLTDYGICTSSKRDGRSLLYTMLPPKHLAGYIGKKVRQLDTLAEKLDGAVIAPANTSYFREVSGQEAVQDMLELALRCKNRHWQIIAPRKNALSFMTKDYTTYFKKVRTERQIVSQSLWEQNSAQELLLKDVLMRKPRYVPHEIAVKIPTLQLAFDDCLLIISMDAKSTVPHAMLLQSDAVVTTYKIIFEMAWRSAIKN